jgi:glycosyltransferase involved in cell wall biosynthesis
LKISIITVCYNSVATLADTLASVASQSYPDVEHIVIDGASTDGTQALVEREGHRVKTFISEPDKGIYDAMNKGIRMASGDVIGTLNADDVYADTEVLSRVAVAMAQGKMDAIYGDVMFFTADRPEVNLRRYSSRHFSPSRIAWGWMPAHPTLFLCREIYHRFGLFRTDFRIAGDYEFVARIFKDASLRYHYLPEVLVRMRTGGVSTGGLRSTLLLNREVLKACRENGIRTNLLMLLSKYPIKALEYFSK